MTESNGLNELVNDMVDSQPTPKDNAAEILESAFKEHVSSPDTINPESQHTETLFPEENPTTVTIQKSKWTGTRDAFGTPFDDVIHRIDDNGNPVKNKNGSWQKKRGRKAGENTQAAPATVTIQNTTAEDEARHRTSVIAANCVFRIGVAIGGDEWEPIVNPAIGRNEPMEMVNAFDAYFKETGTIDLPAWAILVLTIGMYAAPRMTMPKTQSRVGIMWTIVKAKTVSIFSMFKRKG